MHVVHTIINQSTEVMGESFSIRVASRLTGLTPETLRMWEHRYGFPKPKRGPSNRRMYSPADVDRLCLIARALSAGYRPSEVIDKDVAELKSLVDSVHTAIVASPRGARRNADPTAESLVDLLLRDEIELIQQELKRLAMTRGPKAFIIEVVQPLLTFMGIQWQHGRLEIRHEHLMSALLTTQMRIAQHQFESPDSQAPVVVLATLAGEKHSLGLEMAALYLTSCRMRAIFLGPEMPAEQIVAAAQSFKARAVGLSITQSSDFPRTRESLRYLFQFLPKSTRVWLGGEGATQLHEFQAYIDLIPSWAKLELAVKALQ